MKAEMQFTEQFDVVVVGAGHAGCEAAMAAARMGLKTALYTLNVDLIAQMSCNPAIGGIAKGHLVREVDALGGIMGEITDAVGIQFRLLNTSRGPAVWSPRAQCDKQAYRIKMREVLESQPNLKIKQAEVAELILERASGSGLRAFANPPTLHDADEGSSAEARILGVKLRDGRTVGAQAVIITTGTFLNGLIHCGEQQYPAGRSGASLNSRETLTQLLSASALGAWRIMTRRFPATSPRPHQKLTASSVRTFIVRRCTAGRFSRSDRVIARRSKTRLSNFLTRRCTSFISSPRA
jgi:glucose-inhibited division protein A